MLSLTGLNQKSTYGLMVKRLRRCPLTAESAVRFRMGLPKKREANTSGVGFAFFVAPERNLRGNLLPSFVFASANLAEGFPLAGNGKFRKWLQAKSIWNLRGNLLPSFVNLPQGKFLPRDSRLRETANSAWGYGMITKSFWSPRGKRGLPSSVSLPQSRKTFFTKEHNSSAFLWVIRLTFPKSYYIIET